MICLEVFARCCNKRCRVCVLIGYNLLNTTVKYCIKLLACNRFFRMQSNILAFKIACIILFVNICILAAQFVLFRNSLRVTPQ